MATHRASGHLRVYRKPKDGNDGQDAVSYQLVPSVAQLTATADGRITTGNILLEAYRMDGDRRSDQLLPVVSSITDPVVYFAQYSVDGGDWQRVGTVSLMDPTNPWSPAAEVPGLSMMIVRTVTDRLGLRLCHGTKARYDVLLTLPALTVVRDGEPGTPGTPGKDGEDAVTYELRTNADMLRLSEDGSSYLPDLINLWLVVRKGTAVTEYYDIESLTDDGYTISCSVDGRAVDPPNSMEDIDPVGLEVRERLVFSAHRGGREVAARSIMVMRQLRGPAIRGPQKWSALPDGYPLQCGAPGEAYLDIVVDDNGNYYQCRTSHLRADTKAPDPAKDTQYWTRASKMGFVATDLLLSRRIKADEIDVEMLMAGGLIARRADGTPSLSINIESGTQVGDETIEDGVITHYYPNGRKCMSFGAGYIVCYNNDAHNTEAWVLNRQGAIYHYDCYDRWQTLELHALGTDEAAALAAMKTPWELKGEMYSEFTPGDSSSYYDPAYIGYTIEGVADSSYAPGEPDGGISGYYTDPGYPAGGAAIDAVTGRREDYSRWLYYYEGGIRKSTRRIRWQ